MSAPDRFDVDVLVPTAGRTAGLALTLGGLLAQDAPARLVLADQSPEPSADAPEVAAVLRLLRLRGWDVELHHRPERLGIAEQRQFLLDRATAPWALFLDADVLLERWVLGRLVEAARELDCGLVGMAMVGASYLDDVRPHEQAAFELWDGPVTPERVRKDVPAWERWRLHNAATPHHLAERVPAGREWTAYKVAWIAGCAMFRTADLRATGGYAFWRDLGPSVRGEDVAAQIRVIERSGGAGLLPSGAWHLELPTSLTERDVDAYAEVVERGDAGRSDGAVAGG